MKRPIDPATFAPKLAALDAQARQLAADYDAELSKLAVTPDDADIEQRAAALAAERRGLDDKRSIVLQAQARAAKGYAEAQRETFVKQLVTDTQQADALVEYMRTTTAEITRCLGNLPPLLTRLGDLSKEYGALVWGVSRAAGLKREQVPEILPLFNVIIEQALHDAGLASVVALPRRPEMRDDMLDRYRCRANEVLHDGIRATAADMAVPDPVPPVKTLDRVELIAVERGHVRGRVIEPGQRFMHDPTPKYPGGAPRPAPKWAKPPKEAAEIARIRAQRSQDTKPKAAAEAVVEKDAEARRALHR